MVNYVKYKFTLLSKYTGNDCLKPDMHVKLNLYNFKNDVQFF